MKKDVVLAPLLPFTSDEESALVERLGTMDGAALAHYQECARNALGNTALEPSWRARIEVGLKHAEAAAVKEAAAAALAAEALAALPPPPPPKVKKTDKAEKAEAD